MVKRKRNTPPPQRRRWLASVGAAVLAAIVGIVVLMNATGGGSASAAQSPPLLAGLDTAANGQTVDGIQSQSNEQVLYHIHAHLAVDVNGTPRTIPAGIGITPPLQIEQTTGGPFVAGGSSFYWLHSHTADGIIHIESPVQRTYTLGNYFDIWGQPLSTSQVGPAHGTVIAYVDGHRFTGNPRDITLGAHTVIQLDVGKDVAPQPFTFPQGL
jgi:hypothetical protein